VPELFIHQVGSPENAARVWPSSAVPPGLVQEAREYRLEMRDATSPDSIRLYLDDVELEALRSSSATTTRWRWSPGFYSGLSRFRIDWGDGRRNEFEVVTDPDLSKVTRADFDQMVQEILQDTFALFKLSSFRTGIGRGPGANIPLARLEFLRSRIGELEQVVREIDRHPIRVLRATADRVPYQKARGVTSTELLRSFRTGPVHKASPGAKLPAACRGHFPTRIWKSQKVAGLDIREHQNIKAALEYWGGWLSLVADRLLATHGDEENTYRQWGNRCRVLARRLGGLLELPLFQEVSDRTLPVVSTSIYRRVIPYRRFFSLYRDINLGLANVAGEYLEMPLARTFDLYELWCFLRLVRAAGICFPAAEIDTTAIFQTGTGSHSVVLPARSDIVPITADVGLAFKRTYREFWMTVDQRGSFSRAMEPDVSVACETEGSKRLIVLDAKYRINEGLNDAVASIHMYRDALVEADAAGDVERIVVAAYLMSPSVPGIGGAWMSTSMPSRLFHPAYRDRFRFGAVTLRPGVALEDVAVVLRAILADAGVMTPA
jgi:hypothetical protein